MRLYRLNVEHDLVAALDLIRVPFESDGRHADRHGAFERLDGRDGQPAEVGGLVRGDREGAVAIVDDAGAVEHCAMVDRNSPRLTPVTAIDRIRAAAWRDGETAGAILVDHGRQGC